MAEFLGAVAVCGGRGSRHELQDRSDRNSLYAMRWSSRSHLRGWTAAHGAALLRERGCPHLRTRLTRKGPHASDQPSLVQFGSLVLPGARSPPLRCRTPTAGARVQPAGLVRGLAGYCCLVGCTWLCCCQVE